MNETVFHYEGIYPEDSAKPEGMTAVCVRRASEEFPFLHDTSVTVLGGRLFAAWYQCTEGEIEGLTQIAGTWSDDGGETWSEPEIVAEDRRYHCVPAAFYESDDGICALVTRMTAHDRPVDVLEVRYDGSAWMPYRVHEIRFLFNMNPVRYLDGSWIAGGRVSPGSGELPQIPALAVRGIDGTWRVQPFDGRWTNGEFPLYCPETAVLRKNGLRAIVRNDHGQPWTFEREEETWRFTGECSLPVHGAKMYAGELSARRDYLLFNERTPQNDRSRLVMLLTEKGGNGGFTKRFVLAEGYDETLQCGPYWHYPCACEWNGTLYVSCTANGPDNARDAVVLRIPIEAL